MQCRGDIVTVLDRRYRELLRSLCTASLDRRVSRTSVDEYFGHFGVKIVSIGISTIGVKVVWCLRWRGMEDMGRKIGEKIFSTSIDYTVNISHKINT